MFCSPAHARWAVANRCSATAPGCVADSHRRQARQLHFINGPAVPLPSCGGGRVGVFCCFLADIDGSSRRGDSPGIWVAMTSGTHSLQIPTSSVPFLLAFPVLRALRPPPRTPLVAPGSARTRRGHTPVTMSRHRVLPGWRPPVACARSSALHWSYSPSAACCAAGESRRLPRRKRPWPRLGYARSMAGSAPRVGSGLPRRRRVCTRSSSRPGRPWCRSLRWWRQRPPCGRLASRLRVENRCVVARRTSRLQLVDVSRLSVSLVR